MSYDEFPSGAQAPATDDLARNTLPAETSVADAPPADPSPGSGADDAGTAAASASEGPDPLAVVPVRSRSRRKSAVVPAAPLEPDATHSGLPETPPSDPSTVVEDASPAPPKTRRRTTSSRKKIETSAVVPADTGAPTEVSEGTLVSGAAEVAPAPEPKTPRRRSRKTVPADAPAPAEPVPDVPMPTTESAASPPTTPRRRRRKVAEATSPTQDVPVQPAPTQEIAPAPEARTDAPEQIVTSQEPAGLAPVTDAQDPLALPVLDAQVELPGVPAERDGKGRETPEAPATGRRRRVRERARDRNRRVEAPDTVTSPPATEEEETTDRTVGAHLVTRQGIPEIHIHGVPYPPVLFFGNMEDEKSRSRVISQIRRAARHGVHLHSTLIELPCPITEDSAALDEIDRRLRAVLDADPEGYVMPRIIFVPARGWKREYPTDISTYADGTTGDPSVTSERFWLEAEHSLTTLIAHILRQEWGRRVFGYHLERGEWFQPADLGYDRSIANRDAFRDWLRERYHNNLVALRAAWYDGDVQFHTAEIPPLILKPDQNRAFYETRRERRYIDFNEFTSETTARRLIALARAVKKATQNQALVSVCYGYTFEFGHPFSGHLALNQLLSCNAINLICGPPSYRDRKAGGAASLPAPVDSPPIHGKLWMSEDDTKTYLAPARQPADDFNPRLGDRFLTEQAQLRAMGYALTHHIGIGFMDLWGEGWLDEDSLWERIGGFARRYAQVLRHHERPRCPDVIAMIDEKSLLHIQRGEPFFRRVTQGVRDVLQRAGVSYGVYLQSDLLSARFPTGARLYLFLTPYRLTVEQRQAIHEKLQRDGKTLVWLYAPGSCEERPGVGGVMEETATATVGITLRQQEWNSELGSRVLKPDHPLTAYMTQREYGIRERLNPSFFVDDPDAVAIAEYQGSGLTSLAVKTLGDWQSVFVGDPCLPLELLRGICRFAGVHVWTPQGDDVVSIGDGWVMLHATRDGHRVLQLPEPTALYDLGGQQFIADEAREHRFFMRAGTTRLFCVAPLERMLRWELPNLTLPGEGRARIVLNGVQQTVEEDALRAEPLSAVASPPEQEAPEHPQPTPDDLATLEAVLNMDISAYEGLELEPPEEFDYLDVPTTTPAPAALAGLLDRSDPTTPRRRRRRRGGRGRGRRRQEAQREEGTPGGEENGSSAS
ncbi:MAG: hypothetical protein RMJ43_04415 [Chloroherpetonaceae bacterium]|nr:hypothetical protein [Chthonomonadaceae bacterium]MDW8207057.1 hypothetical protein [Chloroherpetonaceae bacterium]